MYLSLPLPSVRNSKVSLYSCLDAFVGEEIMEKGDAWSVFCASMTLQCTHNCLCRKCPHCKVLRKATKQLSLSRLPPVLLIQLKRFSFNGPFTDKLDIT